MQLLQRREEITKTMREKGDNGPSETRERAKTLGCARDRPQLAQARLANAGRDVSARLGCAQATSTRLGLGGSRLSSGPTSSSAPRKRKLGEKLFAVSTPLAHWLCLGRVLPVHQSSFHLLSSATRSPSYLGEDRKEPVLWLGPRVALAGLAASQSSSCTAGAHSERKQQVTAG